MKSRLDNLVDHLYEIFATDERDNPYVNHVTRASLASADNLKVFSRGAEIIPATQLCLERTHQEVLMQFYNFQDDCEAGTAIKEALIKINARAREVDKVITVKMMVNFRKGPAAYFTRSADDPFTWLQQDDKGVYLSLHGKKFYLDKLNIETKLHNHYLFDSYHSKQIIIDRKCLMLFSGDFTKVLDCKDGEVRQLEVVTVVDDHQLALNAASSFYERWNDGEQVMMELIDTNHGEQNDDGIPVLLLEKKSSTDPIKRALYKSPLKIAFAEAVRSAEKNIKIMTPNINDDFIANEIVLALKRGITVQLFTGKYMNEQRQSQPGMGGTNLDNICKIYESLPISCWDNFQVNWACDNSGALVLGGSRQSMHAKVVIIDDKVVLAGSSPLDKQAAYFSEESDILVVSPLVAEKYLRIFIPAFAAGENFNFFSLLNLKSAVARDVQHRMPEALLIDACDQVVGLQRVVFIDALANMLKRADNYGDFMAILKLSLEVAESNPLAKVSVQGVFAKTKVMASLTKAYSDNGIRLCNDGIFVDVRRISM